MSSKCLAVLFSVGCNLARKLECECSFKLVISCLQDRLGGIALLCLWGQLFVLKLVCLRLHMKHLHVLASNNFHSYAETSIFCMSYDVTFWKLIIVFWATFIRTKVFQNAKITFICIKCKTPSITCFHASYCADSECHFYKIEALSRLTTINGHIEIGH